MGKPVKIDINDQLNRILDSEEFLTAKMLSEFLKFIVTETLEMRSTTLQAYTIALEVFGRSSSFDPQQDSIVRVQAGQLRLRLETYYAQAGRGDPVLIRIPKGGYVPTFIHREEPAKTITIVTEVGDPTPSIIVLPFSNLSEDAGKDYFGIGLTEDIIAALSCFPDVKLYAQNLTSTKSSLYADTIALATDFNVRFLLDGSFRHGRSGLRISARLVEIKTRKILWNRSYDRCSVAADIFDVENKIAVSVAAEIAGPSGNIAKHDLLEISRRPPENMSAYDAVLRAYGYLHNPGINKHREISKLLVAAVKDDPKYSDAAVMLSRMYLDQNRFGFNVSTTVEDALDRSEYYARQAIDCAPNNAVAWHLLSMVHFARQEFELCEQAGERSLSISPNHPDMLTQFGIHLWILGQRERGIKLTEKALALTPFPPGSYYLTFVHEDYLNGRDEQALRNALRLKTPGLFWMYLILAAIYGQLGQTIEAKKALCKLFELRPSFSHLTIEIMEAWPFQPVFTARLIDGLKKAGFNVSNNTKIMN